MFTSQPSSNGTIAVHLGSVLEFPVAPQCRFTSLASSPLFSNFTFFVILNFSSFLEHVLEIPNCFLNDSGFGEQFRSLPSYLSASVRSRHLYTQRHQGDPANESESLSIGFISRISCCVCTKDFVTCACFILLTRL